MNERFKNILQKVLEWNKFINIIIILIIFLEEGIEDLKIFNIITFCKIFLKKMEERSKNISKSIRME